MLKNIAAARSDCTAKHKSKASYNTDYTVADLIDLFGDDWKEIKTQMLLVISENFLSSIRKNNVLAVCISY